MAARRRGTGDTADGRSRTARSLRRQERVSSCPQRSGTQHGRSGTGSSGGGTAAAPVAFHLTALGRTGAGDRRGVDHSSAEHTVFDDAAEVAGKALTRGAQASRAT